MNTSGMFAGVMSLLRRAFKGAPNQHWATSYKAGDSVVILSFTCHSPLILTKKQSKGISIGTLALDFASNNGLHV